VFFNSGLTNNKDDFELCLRAENVELPKSGYFGVSAATGGLAGKCLINCLLIRILSNQILSYIQMVQYKGFLHIQMVMSSYVLKWSSQSPSYI